MSFGVTRRTDVVLKSLARTLQAATPSLSAHAYAATVHLAETMKQNGSRQDVQRALMKAHDSIFGPVNVASDGDFLMPARVLTVGQSSEIVPAALPARLRMRTYLAESVTITVIASGRHTVGIDQLGPDQVTLHRLHKASVDTILLTDALHSAHGKKSSIAP